MHVMRALVGVDGFQVRCVTHHVILDLDAVAAVHVASHPRDIESLAAIVALDDGDHLRSHPPLVEQSSHAQCALQSQRNLSLHVSELFLHELCGGERPAELLAVERVLASALPAVLGRAITGIQAFA